MAQYSLGRMFAKGTGVIQDYQKAEKWYRLGAEQGLPEAQSTLGKMYLQGQGVPQNYQEAEGWFRKASDQGNSHGQHLLGMMYRDGLGLKQDDVEAYKWFTLSATQGYEDAVMDGETLTSEMGAAHIEEAQRRVQQWYETHER